MIKTIRKILYIFSKKFYLKPQIAILELHLNKNSKKFLIFLIFEMRERGKLMLASPAGPLAEMMEINGEKIQEQASSYNYYMMTIHSRVP